MSISKLQSLPYFDTTDAIYLMVSLSNIGTKIDLSLQLEVPPTQPGNSAGYFLRGNDDPTYFPGRSAEIVAYGVVVGRLGVLHPETLLKFELSLPVAAMEINIEPFL